MPNIFVSNQIQNSLIIRLLELAKNETASVQLKAISQLIRIAETVNSPLLWTEIVKLAVPLVTSHAHQPDSIFWLPSLICHSPEESETRQALLTLLETSLQHADIQTYIYGLIEPLLSAISQCQETALSSIFFAHLDKIVKQDGVFVLPAYASKLDGTIKACKNEAKLKELIPLFIELLPKNEPTNLVFYLVNSIPFIWQVSNEAQRGELKNAFRSIMMTKNGVLFDQIFESMLRFSDPSLRMEILNIAASLLAHAPTNFTARLQASDSAAANELMEETFAMIANLFPVLKQSLDNVSLVLAGQPTNANNLQQNSLTTSDQLGICDANAQSLRKALAKILPTHVQTASEEELTHLISIIELLSENITEHFARMLPQLFVVAPKVNGVFHALTRCIEKVLNKGKLLYAIHAHDFALTLPKAIVQCQLPHHRVQLMEYLNRLLAETVEIGSIKAAIAKGLPEAITICGDEALRAELKNLFMKLMNEAMDPTQDDPLFTLPPTLAFRRPTQQATQGDPAAEYRKCREANARSIRNGIVIGLTDVLPLLFCAAHEQDKQRLMRCLSWLVQSNAQLIELSHAIALTIATVDEIDIRNQLVGFLETITFECKGYMRTMLAKNLTNALNHCKDEQAFDAILHCIHHVLGADEPSDVRTELAKSFSDVIPQLFARTSLPARIYDELHTCIGRLADDSEQAVRLAILERLPAMITSCPDEIQSNRLFALFREKLKSSNPVSPVSFGFFNQLSKAITMKDPVKGLRDLNRFTETLRDCNISLAEETVLLGRKACEM